MVICFCVIIIGLGCLFLFLEAALRDASCLVVEAVCRSVAFPVVAEVAHLPVSIQEDVEEARLQVSYHHQVEVVAVFFHQASYLVLVKGHHFFFHLLVLLFQLREALAPLALPFDAKPVE
jgi:hypothetical protein